MNFGRGFPGFPFGSIGDEAGPSFLRARADPDMGMHCDARRYQTASLVCDFSLLMPAWYEERGRDIVLPRCCPA